jgi:carbonic anhydrase
MAERGATDYDPGFGMEKISEEDPMKALRRSKFVFLAAFAGTVLQLAPIARAQEAHWSYAGEEGPQHWDMLSPAYALCGQGKMQSPIDIRGASAANLKPIQFEYGATVEEIVNNGHTIQANSAPGSRITVDGHVYELKQFHFHAPSENTIAGKTFPLEGHLVHADKDGKLAVVAVMFQEGPPNEAVAAVWAKMPAKKDGKAKPAASINAGALLPKGRSYYSFNGSLTTPPCTEGVRWLVIEEPSTVSHEQVEAFEKVMKHHNNRPVQASNGRPVLAAKEDNK